MTPRISHSLSVNTKACVQKKTLLLIATILSAVLMLAASVIGVVSVTNNMKNAFHELSSEGTQMGNPLSEAIRDILTGTFFTMLTAVFGFILTVTFLTLLILELSKWRSYPTELTKEIESNNENHRRPRNP